MSNLANMFADSYQVFDDDENLVSVGTALAFWDEDVFALYVERVGSRLRFFDDGLVMMHMYGSGIDFDNKNLTQSVAMIAEPEGVTLNGADLEIWAESSNVAGAFSRYMSAILALMEWEAAEVSRLSRGEFISLEFFPPVPAATDTHPASSTPAAAAGTA